MTIVFTLPGTEPRPKVINGETTRFGGAACSGTDQSVILVSEYLASNGYDVTIVLHKTDFKTINNVKYTDFSYSGISKEVDILIANLWFDDYDKLPFRVTKSLFYWYHMAWGYSMAEIEKFCLHYQLDLNLIYPSSFALSQTISCFDDYRNKGISTKNFIIPNPLDEELIEKVLKEPIERNKKQVIFHAQYGRGGDVAKRALEEFNSEYKLEVLDYINPENGVDKLTLFRKLAGSEIFLFPLYHPNGTVYKDTFSCSVAEAIALGVKVITYPLGAFTEYFNEGCYYANFPINADINDLARERVSLDAHYMKETDTLVEALDIVVNNTPEYLKNLDYTTSNFRTRLGINRIGKEWLDIIKKYEN
jgi:glycosyltransferase involved in cell wall biosynthesis